MIESIVKQAIANTTSARLLNQGKNEMAINM